MMPYAEDVAATIALEALTWLVAQDDLLPVFLGSTGASLADLKTGAAESGFQTSVLDFLLMDDVWVQDCAAALGRAPDALMRARAGLAGGAETHWT